MSNIKLFMFFYNWQKSLEGKEKETPSKWNRARIAMTYGFAKAGMYWFT